MFSREMTTGYTTFSLFFVMGAASLPMIIGMFPRSRTPRNHSPRKIASALSQLLNYLEQTTLFHVRPQLRQKRGVDERAATTFLDVLSDVLPTILAEQNVLSVQHVR
jgi:hypothetical protein